MAPPAYAFAIPSQRKGCLGKKPVAPQSLELKCQQKVEFDPAEEIPIAQSPQTSMNPLWSLIKTVKMRCPLLWRCSLDYPGSFGKIWSY